MSYCRFSDADVYMFRTIRGGIVCQSCLLARLKFEVHVGNSFLKNKTPGLAALDLFLKKKNRPAKQIWLPDIERKRAYGLLFSKSPEFLIRSAALLHVALHRRNGDYVPLAVDERLKDEINELGDVVSQYRLNPTILCRKLRRQ